ncbi:MAG: SpoIID/LytB domain-containing protein [Spirochaetia bacterium]|nr:SpoIID/LytB domain-containing protein [Spirochaetota bacterium]MCX8095988.1 SpoIID/LytB domain-containing protein [Spirochaetota bacterium]MDW8113021.1 SpoIID/LytB domain-containing protein [Spirochaetia bacterium]
MREILKHIVFAKIIVFIGILTFSCIPRSSLKSIATTDKVRVLIGIERSNFKITSEGLIVINGIPFNNEANIYFDGSKIVANDIVKDSKIEIFSDSYLQYIDKKYPGFIRLITSENGIMVINVVELEEYLSSVVPSEVPALWPMEVLKAQAIVSRTYAVRKMIENQDKDYDVVSTYKSQVYSGISKVHPRTSRAVRETEGIVITHNDEVIFAFFHANSGGYTEKPEIIGVKENLPYLKPVIDNYSKNTFRSFWKTSISKKDFLNSIFGRKNLKMEYINIPYRLPSGSIAEIEVVANDGKSSIIRRINVNRFREIFPMVLSPKFEIDIEGDNIVFTGIGWGHGVGMSQWGAKEMAIKGYNYKEIIRHYYNDVELVKIY